MPGHTWALIGATALVVIASGAVIGVEWRRRAVTPWPWRAIERLGLALWALVGTAIDLASWPPGLQMAPIAIVGIGLFGTAATRAGLIVLLRWPIPLTLASMPLLVAVLSLLPDTSTLVTHGDAQWHPGPVLVLATIWLTIGLAGTSLLEIGAARQAVGPLRTDVVRHGVVAILLMVAITVALWLPVLRQNLAWAPVAVTVVALVTGPALGAATVPMFAPTTAVIDVVSDALAVVGTGGKVVDTNKAGARAFLADPDGLCCPLRQRELDPNLVEALTSDGERTLTTQRGMILRIRTATVRENGTTIATILSARDVTEVERLKSELLDLAARDALTGLYNRRNLGAQLASMTTPKQLPASLALVDLDHLKVLNDRFGHQVGDEAIVRVAKILADSASDDDLVFRVGGDEFLVAMPHVDAESAELRAQQWRVTAGRLDLGPDTPRVTLSIGVTQLVPGMSVESFISAADQALYAAKAAGRNRVRVRTAVLAGEGEP